VQVLWHLAEIQRRKLFSPSYRSLFDYAVAKLGYSEDQAARRIAAMRLLVDVPEIEPQVSSGALNLTTMGLAQTFFRSENESRELPILREEKVATLSNIAGKSSRDAARTLIGLSTAPEKMHYESTRPLTASTSEIRVAVKDETIAKFAQLKGLLAHKYPRLTTADLLDLVCDLAIAELDPAKLPRRSTDKHSVSEMKPRPNGDSPTQPKLPSVPAPELRRAPKAQLKREIWRNARGRCEKCGSAHRLEVDHIKPFALGGRTALENLRLLCRNCNQRESIKIFGVHAPAAPRVEVTRNARVARAVATRMNSPNSKIKTRRIRVQ
jgi:hypothetical protein